MSTGARYLLFLFGFLVGCVLALIGGGNVNHAETTFGGLLAFWCAIGVIWTAWKWKP